MPLFQNEILHTILVRPYVFLFLAAYLVISIASRGWRRSLLFLASGYLIAWASEAASIKTGFPYGRYSYLYENLQGEWLNAGVPVWDSLSYVFLCYAGMELAKYIFPCESPSPHWGEGRVEGESHLEPPPSPLPSPQRERGLIRLALLAALFVTLLDIVIDPVANMGERWFLGKIYFYPEPGFYFGVPLSNFAGWFLVSFVIVGLNLFLAKKFSCSPLFAFRFPLLGPLLYFGIFLFNWIITLVLGEYLLAALDCVWISIPLLLFRKALKS